MTESVLDTRQDTADYDDPPPMRRGMPVTIVEDDTAPDLAVIGSFRTITLTGAEAPFRLLAQDRRRKKATVLVKSDPSYAPTQFVLQSGGSINGAGGSTQVGGTITDLGPLGSDVNGLAGIVTIAGMTGTTPSVAFAIQTTDDPIGAVGWTTLNTSSAVTGAQTTRVQSTGPFGRYVRMLAVNWGNADNVANGVQAVLTASTSQPVSEVPQSIMLGRQSQVSNNQGALFYAGDTIIYEAESEVWCTPQPVMGHVLLSVIEERRTPRD